MQAAAPDRVALTALTLTDFRNYASLSLRPQASLVAFVGPNGAGKTNLLEALSLLSPGRGLRRAAYAEIGRIGAPAGWAVAATVVRAGVETRLGTGFAGGTEGGRKLRVDSAPAAAVETLLDYLRVLWLTPAMDGLFVGPAGDRRRFLDRLVLSVDPAHGGRVREFERLLAGRNRLLEEDADPAWCDAVETELAERAVAVAAARSATVARLAGRIAEQAAGSAFPAAGLRLAGDFDARIAARPAAEAAADYRRELRDGRRRDRAAGRTLAGPHRSDLEVAFAAKAMPAALSSTGEQKALLIGLVLAHAELVAAVSGMTPLLLLDEVAAHLDEERRAALFQRLAASGAQTFMTGTEAALFGRLPDDAALYAVADGALRPLSGRASRSGASQ